MKRLLACLLLAACSTEQPSTETPAAAKAKTPPPPSVAEARELIAGSAELGQYEFSNAGVSIAVARSSMSEPVRAMAKDLAAAGWLAFDGAGDVLLTDKSRDDKRFLMRSNGILDIVPLAKKEMGNVSSVTDNGDGTATAGFDFRWVPNEVGAAITSGPVHDRFAAPQHAQATLIWDGTSWSVLEVRRIEN